MIEVNTHCKYCLKQFDAKSVRAVFCSSKCRVYFRRETEYKSKPFVNNVTDDYKPVLEPIIENKVKRIVNKTIVKSSGTAVGKIISNEEPVKNKNESSIDFKIRLQQWKDKRLK